MGTVKHTSTRRLVGVIAGAVSGALVVSAAAYLMTRHAPDTLDAGEPAAQPVTISVNYAGIRAAAADLAAADGTLRALVDGRADAHRGLVHRKGIQRLPMPAIDTEQFDDAAIMRARARMEAELFIDRYAHNQIGVK